MVANLSTAPYISTVGQGLFASPDAIGFVQGLEMPDPAVRFQRRMGLLSQSETKLMYGGCAIYEQVPGLAGGPITPLGPIVGRATSITGGTYPIRGFSVFTDAFAMVATASSPVPLSASGMQVNSYRLGSGARIPVACDPGLAAALIGGDIGAAVTWDLVNQILVPYTGAVTISSGTYNSTSGLVTLTMASPTNLSPGDSVTVSGATGTGSFASINGTYTAGAGTTGSTVTYTIAASLTLTITGGSLTTGTALPIAGVLGVSTSNNMTVNYNSSTGIATWNYNGAAALIQL